jgi:glycosyltransferase involved in cell wall biosynthesis
MTEAAQLSTGPALGNRGPTALPVVLQVLPSLVTGGAERGAIDVAVALARAGGTPVVASAGGPMVHELDRHGVRHVAMPLASKNPLVMWRNARRLEDLVRETGAQVVHARSRAPAWSAWLAARRAGVPFMTTFHAPYNFKGEAKRLYNSVMARGERVIAISEFIRDHVLTHYAVEPARVRVIHRGIDVEHFSPARVHRERMVALARAWRVPEDRHVIMLPGRLTRWKGQAVLIEALARLRRRDFYCLLVGSDQGRAGYRQELLDLVRAHGLEGHVHLADHCSDMAAAYLLSEVVVNASSDPEAFGRVIVEAQAMGRPVIVTNHGAVRETVLAGETGWVVPPGDVESLASALEEALGLSPDEREEIAGRAIEFVSGRFTRERMCAATLDIYRELAGEPPRRAAGQGPDSRGA